MSEVDSNARLDLTPTWQVKLSKGWAQIEAREWARTWPDLTCKLKWFGSTQVNHRILILNIVSSVLSQSLIFMYIKQKRNINKWEMIKFVNMSNICWICLLSPYCTNWVAHITLKTFFVLIYINTSLQFAHMLKKMTLVPEHHTCWILLCLVVAVQNGSVIKLY